MSYSQKFDPPEAPLLSTESNPTTAPPPETRRPQTIEKTAPPAPGEPPPSGLGIVVRVVGLWILLPLALMYLIKMLVL